MWECLLFDDVTIIFMFCNVSCVWSWFSDGECSHYCPNLSTFSLIFTFHLSSTYHQNIQSSGVKKLDNKNNPKELFSNYNVFQHSQSWNLVRKGPIFGWNVKSIFTNLKTLQLLAISGLFFGKPVLLVLFNNYQSWVDV